MARHDKSVPGVGSFRAPLNAAFTGAAAPLGVGLNSSGRVVAGAGATGIIGVVCSPVDMAAGDPIDVYDIAEFVEFGGAAGTIYTADTTTGVIGTTAASATKTKIGFTVEADRLIVRVNADRGFDAT